jgi:ABC-type multidrug transport system fused ATPase/permease subunit
MMRTLVRSVALVFRSGPASLLGVALLAVANGLLPAANVSAIAAVVGAVSAYAASGTPEHLNQSVTVGMWFAGALIATFVCGRVAGMLDAALRIRCGAAIRMTFIRHTTAIDIEQFESADALDTVHRAGVEGSDRVVGLTITVFGIMSGLVTLASVSVILLAWDPLAALLLVIAPFPSFIASVRMSRRHYQVDIERTGERRLAGYLERLLLSAGSIREVRILGGASTFLAEHSRIVHKIAAQDSTYVRRAAVVEGGLGLAGIGLYLVAIWRAVATALTAGAVGQLTGYLQAIGSLQQAAGQVVTGLTSLHEDLLYSANLFAYLEMPAQRIPDGDRQVDRSRPAEVRLCGVDYAYPSSDRPVLRGVDLHVPAGAMVAVVGRNGSGKTTLARLIGRLCAPSAGAVLVNGIDADSYSVASLRSSTSFVFQDPVRFQMTLRDNVTIGLSAGDVDDSRVLTTLAAVGASPIELGCTDLDDILGRELGSGVELSTGQWQRVALARGLYRRSSIFLFDEPTSSQDAVSERELVALLARMAGHTRIVITHSAEVAAAADIVLVVEDGSVRTADQFAGDLEALVAGVGSPL